MAHVAEHSRKMDKDLLVTNREVEELKRQTVKEELRPEPSSSKQVSRPELEIVNGRPVINENPFNSDDSDEEYDASGKNPFSE